MAGRVAAASSVTYRVWSPTACSSKVGTAAACWGVARAELAEAVRYPDDRELGNANVGPLEWDGIEEGYTIETLTGEPFVRSADQPFS